MIKVRNGKDIPLHELFKNKIEGSRNQVRDNCQKKYNVHLRTRGNTSGGKGNRVLI